MFFNGSVVGDPLMALIGDRESKNGSEVAAAMLREMMTARTIVVAEPIPQTELDLEFTLPDELELSAAVPAAETDVRSFADVLSTAEEDFPGWLEVAPATNPLLQDADDGAAGG